MQAVACIIYSLKCIRKAYEDPGKNQWSLLAFLSCRYHCCMVQHTQGIFPDEIIHVISDSQCTYIFISLSSHLQFIDLSKNVMLKTRQKFLSTFLFRGQCQKYHSNMEFFYQLFFISLDVLTNSNKYLFFLNQT